MRLNSGPDIDDVCDAFQRPLKYVLLIYRTYLLGGEMQSMKQKKDITFVVEEKRLRQLFASDIQSRVRKARRRRATARTFWNEFFVDLCDNLSFHGLNHFVDGDRSFLEKIFWAILLCTAAVAAFYSINEIWISYEESDTETVVETTYYKNSQIAFPAVVICPASRVDWTKVPNLNKTSIPEYSKETEPAIYELLKALSIIEFGEFDHFERIAPYREILYKLKTLRITELLLKVIRTCDEMFVGRCWWRSHEIDCCTIFELQKTEFGYCYAFNSDLSEFSKKLSVVKNGINSYWKDPDGMIRPRKTGSRGQWSGLRVTVSTPSSILPPDMAVKSGVKILIGEPRTYNIGGDIPVPAGQFGRVHVWGDRIHSTDRLRNMNRKKRHCMFSDEAQALGLPYYLRQNCKTDCYKDHTYKYCNCSPDFMFFEANENNLKYPPCTVEDLFCLRNHNNIFNNMIPNMAHSYFETNESGILCDCKADCIHQMYIAEGTVAEESNSSEEVLLDIHFRQSTCILYRSDVKFGWLDLLVSFGGCTGLFLGGSLLSCLELIYFFTLRLYCHWQHWNRHHERPAVSSVVAKNKY
ncbi:hypothetical protein V9T40_014123 [Parthenolecanium corni]|uniref:Sodium channel protein Nach n=1 Tax=Parthenolecanium corni TaxID=536013 RepID=A0AAN9TEK8_9HEMI